MSAQPHLPWLDTTKGLGIILVIVGHVLLRSDWPPSQAVISLIYLFHMPLFFILAGVTLRQDALKPFAYRKAATLLIPYIFFLALLGLPALAASCAFAMPMPTFGIDRCPVMAAKLILGGSTLGGIFGAAWFVPCLLLALLLAQFLLARCTTKNARWVAALLSLTIAAYALPVLPGSTVFLSLGIVPMATLLVLTGYALSRTPPALRTPAFLACSAMAVLAIAFDQSMDMKAGDHGTPIFALAGALALALLTIKLCQALTLLPPISPLLRWLGRRSLTILFLHQAIHLGLRELGLSHDPVLILVSLAIPALLHNSLAHQTTLLRLHLFPKSSPA